MTDWPLTFQDVLAARRRLRGHLSPTALRRYAPLDAAVGHGIEVWVKHENHQPTNSFKARNGLSAVSALPPEARARGVVAASRGNHGQGVAWAGALLGAPVVICVPQGNSPEKNEAMRGLGAEVVEEGRDYDESVAVADRLVRERGLTLVHSTNDATVIAGAATLTLEILEQEPHLDALVLAVGGGSQAVGGLTVARTLRPDMPVYGVQADAARAIHDSWHAGEPLEADSARTFADGLATRKTYALTFPALREGLTDFVTVSEDAIADAVRLYLRTTHNLVEGAGATGLAGLRKLAPQLAGKRVGVVISGGNIDEPVLRRVLAGEGPYV
jgi:threonine dehydratase